MIMKTAFARPFIGEMHPLTVPTRPTNLGSLVTTASRTPGQPPVPVRPSHHPLPALISDRGVPARPATVRSIDYVDLWMRCAVADKPVALRFQRSEANPKHFSIRQILTGSALTPANMCGATGNPYSDASINFDDVQCPHCAAPGGTLYCFSCRSLICRGGVTEQQNGVAVKCACGATGFLVIYRTVYETVYRDRICIGHIEQVATGRRTTEPGTGNFFDCCDKCDIAASGVPRRGLR
jgi:hypothetical protein